MPIKKKDIGIPVTKITLDGSPQLPRYGLRGARLVLEHSQTAVH